VAFANALPVFTASDPVCAKKFADARVPVGGDDINSPVGATGSGVAGGSCHRVNAYFPKSSIDDDREGSSAVVEDDRGPGRAAPPGNAVAFC
jgi:hypothetical protein